MKCRAFIHHEFTVTEGGSYTWWIRLNPFRNRNGGGDYSYSIDNGPWLAIDLSYVTSRLDLVDPGIDIRFIAWTFGDVFEMARGSHTLKVRISDRNGADKDTHGGIDVMAFTNFPWAPTGVVRPDPNPPAPGPDDWFMLMAGPDPHSAESIIDMSYLIEKPAGTHGFLKRDGKDFAFEDGTAVKFWGVDAGMSETVQSQHRQARFYAKHGIKMVRQHPVQSVLGLLQATGRKPQFDPAKLDKWDRWFSTLKDNGIYMTWSLFYPHVITQADGYRMDLYNDLPDRGAGGHNITTGSVANGTHMTKAGRGILSSGFWQVEDKPFIMTEWTQLPPNQSKAEIAPLFAFYGMGLQGWDASYHFAASRAYMGNGWPSMRSYVTCTPHYLGQFPALTCAIYNNHLDEGDIVSARRLSTADIFAGIDSLAQKHGLVGYDQNELLAHADTPVEALAIGRVTLKVEDGQPPSHLGNLSAYWDRQAQTITSNTGQLTWDYGDKVVTVRSEKTQGVIGFAGGLAFDLPGVTVEVGPTPFVSLLFTPLDNRPLIESAHILITAMAQDKQYGTVYNEDGTKLIETGGPPLLLEPVQATLTFKGAPLSSAKVVDVYGVPAGGQIERSGNTFAIDGRYATYYYEVKR